MTTRMHRISKTLGRLRPRWPQPFEIPSPTLDLTWTDIMQDLDPDWSESGWHKTTQKGGLR